MKVLEWPSRILDLHQIEMLLHELNQPVHAGKPSSVTEFKNILQRRAGQNSSTERLTVSYHKHLIVVLAAKAGTTTY